MGRKRRTPAIFAGLVGSGVWAVPMLAQAAPAGLDPTIVSVTMDDLLASPVAYVAVGAIGGAALTGAIVGGASHHRNKRLRAELERARQASAAGIIRISSVGHVLDIADEPPVRETADAVAPSMRDTASLRPRVARQVPLGGGPAPAGVREDFAAPEMARPAHVSARLDRVLPRVEDSAGAFGEPEQKPEPEVASSRPAAAPEPKATRHGTLDYEQVAENYVRSNESKQRREHRSRGVRAVLSERLGDNIMQGLPVIERADGSTTDIGTSWWDTAVGSTHSFVPLDTSAVQGMRPADQASDPMSTADLRAAEQARAERNAREAGFDSASLAGPAVSDTARLDRTARSTVIASRLPVFDESLFPEEHEEASSGEDLFEVAMRAMDEKLPNTAVTTSEEAAHAAGPLSADLETGAVVSAESLGGTAGSGGEDEIDAHVDSLVRDEMEHRHGHPRFTVFDGTGNLSAAQAPHTGKHLATPRKDREA